MIRLENILKRSLQDVFKTSWISLKDVLKMSWKRLHVLKTFLQDFLKTSWRRMIKTIIWSWSRGLEDVFWRCTSQSNFFVLIKTCWRHLLKAKTKDVFNTSSRRFIKTSSIRFIKTNNCLECGHLVIPCHILENGKFIGPVHA